MLRVNIFRQNNIKALRSTENFFNLSIRIRKTSFLYASHSFLSTSSGSDTKKTTSWIDIYTPKYVRPYLHLARADKQIGTYLLFWPCCWGTCLAAPLGQYPDLGIILKFAIGSLIMRSAGCIINDIFDKDIDKMVERTKNRPLASGALTVNQAIGFLTLNLTAGLAVLVTFNPYSILLGFAIMPVVVAYPLMKRFTNWPQLVLGIAFNWGALVGWAAVQGNISLTSAIPLYMSGICWTLVYDTIYGYQDIKDDKLVGVKSTAIYFGNQPQWTLTSLSTGMVTCLCVAGYYTELTIPFYIGISTVYTHLLWQCWTADINDTKNLWLRFSSNSYLGALVAASIAAGHF